MIDWNFGFLAWFALVPWFFAISKQNAKRAFLLSYLVGILFFAGILYWLTQVTIPGYIILVAYLALYFGIFGVFFKHSDQRTTHNAQRITAIFLIPSIWVFLEFIRSKLFTGFGWALLGYSQYKFLPIIQIADITGVWGVSFLIVFANCVIFYSIKNKFKDKKVMAVSILIFIFVLGYGFFKLNQKQKIGELKISVIQSNIPQEIKWEENLKEKIFDKLKVLTQEAANDAPDLIIWPETSVPGFLEEDEYLTRALSELAKDIQIPMLVGAPFFERSTYSYYNSAYLLSKKGNIIARHDKLHLVPFGEYVPLPKIFGFVRQMEDIGDFYPGREYTLFEAENKEKVKFKFGVLICYEDIFPDLVGKFVKKGAQFMVVITNDAWFGRSSAPYQHLQASVFRAVENRISIVRSANTGISCFIDPYGRILSSVSDKDGTEIMATGHATTQIPVLRIQPF